jgi:hypothetical protein
MKTEELLLPEAVRRKAAVSVGGEHAWRQDDVEEVVRQAEAVGLACLGSQVQFQTSEGICEAYWLNFDPEPRREGEPWPDYVERSAGEALDAFHQLCRRTDFRSVAQEWDFVRTKVESNAYDPVDDLWFVLGFATESTLRAR